MNDIDMVMQNARHAFNSYKTLSPAKRAGFLNEIAAAIEAARELLIPVAHEESNLPLPRLNGELSRTTNQLKMFARLIEEGSWVEAAIDTADATRTPPKPDTRKMLLPAGPVVVFGASNFPFAFSTAGGDTASALASGSSVVIKGHSAHAKTSQLVFEAMQKAITKTGVHTHTVQHVLGSGSTAGKALVVHPNTTAVGFTGSFSGGKALWEYANQRETPIPVFAEMSSINPVVFLPDTLQQNSAALAKSYAASIALGMGQFCTNPGLLLAVQSDALDNFLTLLGNEITQTLPQKMLHSGIHAAYSKGLDAALSQKGIEKIGQAAKAPGEGEAFPTVAKVKANIFLQNPHFREEVFGPYSLAVCCDSKEELIVVLKQLKGQLTTTVMATDADITAHQDVIDLQTTLAGRIILNDVPTGVEVCASMVHGGPYPATTDGRFTSVGTTAIKRWVRPVCFQGFKNSMLPDALKNGNPQNIWRIVNNEWTNAAI
ncbi:aldehyde dehydrogenase (NADP(+)) [Agriterribacter sp.]|uniref:aldehyde dehydrogenase (NADP(+)) n=1 Tax=Agriterribacter sp. TaxID=2821509 RepID=UPI002C650EFB|nr:aldehyde dehydrogenase (NADP(+)) [Agriterribacter sp.]HTN05549.1 aldehyde dehydrogenase (NADP(+)) [Agriterribacter sp.]